MWNFKIFITDFPGYNALPWNLANEATSLEAGFDWTIEQEDIRAAGRTAW